MRFHCFIQGASGGVVSSRHTTLRAVRGRLDGGSVPLPGRALWQGPDSVRGAFIDLLAVASEPDQVEVARWLDAGIVVTARVFPHLSERERSGASLLPETLADGCALHRLAVEFDAAELRSSSGWVMPVVLKFLASDPLDPCDPIPRLLARGLRDGRFRDLKDIVRREEWELLSVPGIGPRTVRDLAEWVARRTEAMHGRLRLETVRQSIRPARWTSATGDLVARLHPAVQWLDLAYVDGVPTRLRATLSRHNVRCLGNLCRYRDTDLLRWRGFGRASLDRLQQIAHRIERQCPDDPGLTTAALTRRLLLARPLLSCVRSAIDRLSARWREIVRGRILSSESRPKTQRQIAEELGISAGRVGQIERRAFRRLDPKAHLSILIDDELARHVPPRGQTISLTKLEAAHDWFAGVAARPLLFERVLGVLRTDYLVGDGGVAARLPELDEVRRWQPPPDPPEIPLF